MNQLCVGSENTSAKQSTLLEQYGENRYICDANMDSVEATILRLLAKPTQDNHTQSKVYLSRLNMKKVERSV
ncbi:uncharacterized protein PHALS_14137 [Plasmopara halstedii]|uniref:Uncharacterized protein n=1 Tax=Plasmopara halstedii TaxID=4781 RepID=A0A0P1ARQ4_PLAHL|nr:uncharacterized protein PHALS_14137 [Plasmopara halstedii]CEG43848.1 hypothetical protein PHALS_14137 [Plasmopara halstedii]|eukprot:XP_024580217.1 hypothetical protein PHALS_14137 [Plasmopara halstedii]